MPSPLLHISPGPGFLFFLPYSKTSVSHLVIITSDFFNNFLSSSRPFVQMGWVKGGQKNFHTKTFLCNLTRKARNWSEQKSQLKIFFFKMGLQNLLPPFIIIVYPVSSLEKINLFLGKTSSTETCMSGERCRVKLSVCYCKLQLNQKAEHSKSTAVGCPQEEFKSPILRLPPLCWGSPRSPLDSEIC